MDKSFQSLKIKFDNLYKSKKTIKPFLPRHLNKKIDEINIRNSKNQANEEYFKWQLAYCLTESQLYPKQNIGTEVNFPKGNSSSNALKMDIAVFTSDEWFIHYENFHKNNNQQSLNWLRENLIVAIECKKEDSKNIETVWNQQLKSYLKESERDFCLGMIYDTERMYLFKKINNKFIRYSDNFNTKGLESKVTDLSLETPDPYINLPSFNEIQKNNTSTNIDRENRITQDLQQFSGHNSTQVNDIISEILKTMQEINKVDIDGFRILIQVLTLKIYDEIENNNKLKFYILDEEFKSTKYTDKANSEFINRINQIEKKARLEYKKILSNNPIDLSDKMKLKLIKQIVFGLQDYSFIKSQKTDIYQLVFYKFGAEFTKADKSQFLTPLEIIKFMVSVINPKEEESICDPTSGIGDFLSISYVEGKKIQDKNLFGLDIDPNMIMLSTLNMLLNGDGNAKIHEIDDPLGSLKVKFDENEDLVELLPHSNQNGNWDIRQDGKKLKKFNVILTNPPFGKGQAFEPKNNSELELIQCYETWKINGQKDIDKGVLFLENAYRTLADNGKLGIVLSSSILGIKEFEKIREWFWNKMRIVGFFDLPSGVFFDAGINAGILIAYKPKEKKLKELQDSDYEIYSKSINNVGYTIKKINRVPLKVNNAKRDPNNDYKVMVGNDGDVLLEEDFTHTLKTFKTWAETQETELKKIFL